MNRIAIALLLAGCAGVSFAQQAAKPEDLIKLRKAGYSFMSWNMGKIKANLDGSYNKEQVVAAANAVAAIANSGMGALFAAGTDKDVGEQKTRARPELFMPQHQDKVRELAMNLAREASELARVAAGGDAAAVRTQFGKTGSACKSCHDDFRKD